jgi:predicted nucleic acid-binding protein
VIVLDASAVIEWLLQTPVGAKVEAHIFSRTVTLHTPHLLDVEVAQVLRRYVLATIITAARGGQALDDLEDLSVTRYPHDALLRRVWELRDNLTAYDATYVALAEALDARLVTCDHKMASASGHRAKIRVLS